jgi:hypothetical protein
MQQPPNRTEPFRASKLLRNALRKDVIKPGSRLRIARPLDAESLIGRHEGSTGKLSMGSKASVASQLQKRIGSSRALAKALMRGHKRARSFAFDSRQRAVVKLHYFSHAKGGAGALKAHARYIARDRAAKHPSRPVDEPREEPSRETGDAADTRRQQQQQQQQQQQRQEHWVFYDATRDSVSGARFAEEWARSDKRHFRIILSAENGGRIGDLRTYTRDMMARAEAALGEKLQWFAVDHFDTDNPQPHRPARRPRGRARPHHPA